MRTSERITKCLECGYVDDSKSFSVLVEFDTYAYLCPHCRAGEAYHLHGVEDYVAPAASGNLWSVRYTVVSNELGHRAIADRSTGTRLSSWGSHTHAINEFRSTERKVRRLIGNPETRGPALEAGVNKSGGSRRIPRAGTDRRLFNLSVPAQPRTSRRGDR